MHTRKYNNLFAFRFLHHYRKIEQQNHTTEWTGALQTGCELVVSWTVRSGMLLFCLLLLYGNVSPSRFLGERRQANALAPFLRDGIQVKKQKLFWNELRLLALRWQSRNYEYWVRGPNKIWARIILTLNRRDTLRSKPWSLLKSSNWFSSFISNSV